MEKAMEMSAFEELNEQEMQEVDGGGLLAFLGGLAVGFVVDGIVIATTGKSCGEWVATGINRVKSWFGW